MIAIVLTKITVSLLLIGAAYGMARRWGREPLASAGAPQLSALTTQLSRFVLNVALPSLAFSQILKTLDTSMLRDAWLVPLFGFLLLALSSGVGMLVARVTGGAEHARTAAFLSGAPNWIYLPLPIAEGLFGATGVRTVLLCNIGMLLWLWTGGASILRGRTDRSALGKVFKSPGLWATLLAIPTALLFPHLRHFDAEILSWARPIPTAVGVVLQAIQQLGSLTVPLTLVLTGVQLAEGSAHEKVRWRDLGGVLLARLILAPALAWPVLVVLGSSLGVEVRTTLALIAAMPVAVSGSMFTRQFGGSDALAARSIVVSTVLSLVTVPVLLAFVGSRLHALRGF